MDDEVVTSPATEDGTLYVGVYGFSEESEFKLTITCEGYNMTCEELWETAWNDETYLDLGNSGGLHIDNSPAPG